MSIRTTADENKDAAVEHINEAYKCLLAALDPDTWGSNEFSDQYIYTMQESLIILMKLKRLL